jgi:hypothetical protein
MRLMHIRDGNVTFFNLKSPESFINRPSDSLKIIPARANCIPKFLGKTSAKKTSRHSIFYRSASAVQAGEESLITTKPRFTRTLLRDQLQICVYTLISI